jgi:hypothetical protein
LDRCAAPRIDFEVHLLPGLEIVARSGFHIADEVAMACIHEPDHRLLNLARFTDLQENLRNRTVERCRDMPPPQLFLGEFEFDLGYVTFELSFLHLHSWRGAVRFVEQFLGHVILGFSLVVHNLSAGDIQILKRLSSSTRTSPCLTASPSLNRLCDDAGDRRAQRGI